MIRKLLLVASLATSAFIGAPALAQQAPQAVEKATHGAWTIRCVSTDDSQCVMSQQGQNAQGNPVLLVNFRKTPGLKAEDGRLIPGIMSVAAPTRVLLPAGLLTKIDGTDSGAAGFKYCDPNACIVEEPVSEKFINQMKKGSNIVLTIRGLDGQPVEINMSLSGFTKAFNSL